MSQTNILHMMHSDCGSLACINVCQEANIVKIKKWCTVGSNKQHLDGSPYDIPTETFRLIRVTWFNIIFIPCLYWAYRWLRYTCMINYIVRWGEVNWLFNVTINDISVIHVTAHGCVGGLNNLVSPPAHLCAVAYTRVVPKVRRHPLFSSYI